MLKRRSAPGWGTTALPTSLLLGWKRVERDCGVRRNPGENPNVAYWQTVVAGCYGCHADVCRSV